MCYRPKIHECPKTLYLDFEKIPLAFSIITISYVLANPLKQITSVADVKAQLQGRKGTAFVTNFSKKHHAFLNSF